MMIQKMPGMLVSMYVQLCEIYYVLSTKRALDEVLCDLRHILAWGL